MSKAAPLLEVKGVHRAFLEAERTLNILRGVDLAVAKGEWVSILGRSGSGKSTLLHLVAGLDRADAGAIAFEGADLTGLSGPAMDAWRNRHMGLVFQAYHLLPELSALDNVLLAAMIRPGPFAWLGARAATRARAVELLTRVGLGERLHHKPAKLSGGERQRVAIARALMNRPSLLLADEPTGNLDTQTADEVLAIFKQLKAEGVAILLVTHDETVAAAGDRIVHLQQGVVVG